MSGLIPPVTAVGKNPAFEVRVEDAEKHFMHHCRLELEFSIWASLFSLDFYPIVTLLCRDLMFAVGKVVEIKFCPTAREGEEPHRALLMVYGNIQPVRMQLMVDVKDSLRLGAE